MNDPERSSPQVTDEDVRWAHLTYAAAVEKSRPRGLTGADTVHAHLESVLRPGGLVHRAVADALDDVAAGLVFRHDTTPGSAPSGQAAECADIAERVRLLAAEWREGTR